MALTKSASLCAPACYMHQLQGYLPPFKGHSSVSNQLVGEDMAHTK